MAENKQDILNRSMPAAYKVKLGSTLDEIIAAYNDLGDQAQRDDGKAGSRHRRGWHRLRCARRRHQHRAERPEQPLSR